MTSIASANKTAGELLAGRGQGSEAGLLGISRALTVALNAIEGADRMPPSQVIAMYQDSARTLKARLLEWKALKQQLRDAGLPPLS